MNLIKKLFRRKSQPKTEHATVFAFSCGGIDYYKFEDFNNCPPMRALKTMVFYRQFEMKCTPPFLKYHVEATRNLLRKNPINIYEINKLNEQLSQRIDIGVDTELIYNLASVWFFDKEENIIDFDFTYNARKVEFWKEHLDTDFFLLKPLQEFLPFLKDFDGTFATYHGVIRDLNQLHLENILSQLPPEKMTKLKNRSYSSLAAMPYELEK